jgi:Domain of unknown function (DUF2017)
MTAEFRASGGSVTARFSRAEARIIRDLVSQLAELVSEPPDEPRSAGPEPGPPARDAGPARSDLPAAAELEELVQISGSATLPDDPVLARLLPDGYADDPDAAAEFRRFTESSLRSAKVAAARVVLDSLPERGGRIRLSPDQAQDWLQALNDVRLALGVRLGVTENLDVTARQIPPSDARFPALALLDWLGFLQQSLVLAVS